MCPFYSTRWFLATLMVIGLLATDSFAITDSAGITVNTDPGAGAVNLVDSNYFGCRVVVPTTMSTDSVIWYGYRGFDGTNDTGMIAIYSNSANSATSRLAMTDTLFITATSDTRHMKALSGLTLTAGDTIWLVLFNLNRNDDTGASGSSRIRYTHNDDNSGVSAFGGMRSVYSGTVYGSPPSTLTGATYSNNLRWIRIAVWGHTTSGSPLILLGSGTAGGN